MSETCFRFAEIEYGNDPSNEKIVGLFKFEQPRQNKNGPFQVVIAEITSSLYAYEQLLDVINSAIEQSRTLLAGMTLDPFARFEKLVQRVNDSVASFQDKEPTPINWNRVNIFIIECYQGQICITGHGQLMNLFLQKNEKGNYQTFDLCNSLEQPAVTDPKKVFSALICGDAHPGDLFFIGSNNFERIKQNLQIKEKLMSQPMVAVALEIKKQLEREQIPDDFAAAILACRAEDVPQTSKTESLTKESALQSMAKLQKNEQTTNQILAPTVNPLKSKDSPITSATPSLPKIIEPFRKIWDGASNIFRKRAQPSRASEAALRSMNAGHDNVFTTKRKLTIGAGLAVILIIVVGCLAWSHNKKVAAEQAAWQSAYSQAVEWRNKAEGSLVYAKDDQTRSDIQQSISILKTLSTTKPEQKKQVDSLNADISQLQDKLKRSYKASNIIELVSLPVTATDGMLSAPVMSDKFAFVANNQDKKITRLDLATHESKDFLVPSSYGKIIAGSQGEQSIVFMDDKGQFLALNTSDNSVTPLNKISASSTISDMIVYNKKAYVLEGNDGKIIRLKKTSAGFGGATSYLASVLPKLIGSVALAIDSNVYSAKADGTVIKLTSGAEQAFSLSVIDPALTSLSGIWTDVDDTRLLMTDPAQKRILIFDKNGLLTAQLTSPEFGVLRDIASYKNAKQAVVISNNRCQKAKGPAC